MILKLIVSHSSKPRHTQRCIRADEHPLGSQDSAIIIKGVR